MSNLGTLGLLEGFGKGMQTYGNALYENALADAQARRRENLEKIRFDRTVAENDRNYNRNRQDQLLDQETARSQELEDQQTARQQKLEDQKWALENKQPSVFSEKTSYFDKALAEGRITKEQYDNAMGYASNKGGFTEKERVKMVNNLREDYQSAMSLASDSEKMTFEQWARQNRPEAWSALGGGSSPAGGAQSMPKGDTVPDKDVLDQMYSALMQQDPSTWNAEIQELKESGRVQAANMLRARLQEDQSRLKQSEIEYRKQDSQKQKQRLIGQGRTFANSPYGLLEGQSTLN